MIEYAEYYNGNKYGPGYQKIPTPTNDHIANATCISGSIYLNKTLKLSGIFCEPSNYFYSCIQVLTTSVNNFFYTYLLIIKILSKLTETGKVV